jgi:DNA-directed RNA polymerase specialized sigma24 family protein
VNSVTHLLDELRTDRSPAVEQLWDRYFSRLVALANDQLGSQPRRMADDEDIALSVFDTLVRGAANGKFPLLHDRNDLWCLLITLTRQKVVDLRRYETRQKRGCGLSKNVSTLGYNRERGRMMTLDDLVGVEPSPEYITLLNDEYKQAMQLLRDDILARIAKETLEGYTTSEIAQRMDLSQRTVQRKLMLIRSKWLKQFARDSKS